MLPPLALALAAGLNLYATVACLALAARSGWIAPLPPELRGLEHPLVIAAALLFLVIEALAERVPLLDSIWAAIHALLKPIAAALLAAAVAGAIPPGQRATLIVAAAVLAFGAHIAGGVRAPVERSRRPRRELALHAALAAFAAALAVAARDRPRVATALAAVTLAWVLLRGPRSWRMLTLTLRAQVARLRGVVGRERWIEEEHLPADLRALLDPRDPTTPRHRAARAGVKGLRGVGDYRQGWLVVGGRGPSFVYRSLTGPHAVALPATAEARLLEGPWLDEVELPAERRCCTVLLLKNGPRPELALAHLAPGAADASIVQPNGTR